MATMVGRGYIFGLATFATAIGSVTNYISPKYESLSLTHAADFTEEMDQTGLIDAAVANARGVQCSFRFKPRSSAGVNTLAGAVRAAYLPQVGAGVTITGLSVIKFAGFDDVFNTDSGNTQPWFYDGGGSLEGVNDNVWTGVITLRRYLGITSATAIA